MEESDSNKRRSGWLWLWLVVFVVAVLLLLLWAWPARQPPESSQEVREDPRVAMVMIVSAPRPVGLAA